ncbi:hypothetical protein SAMN06265795_1088 [Noviherbaspirillum humi]|uniref:NADAR domain-containing protein n=1 Tax=Noviherbaspirillum humi TaxID=1688639 RepID=A0A239I191_9BURK|nr:hypothetical protein SAMN06265795_1088 [Noviherbaspirillum humi]
MIFSGAHQPALPLASSSFVHNGIQYSGFLQYVMYQKALLFGDIRMADRILKTRAIAKQRELGRKIRGCVQAAWRRVGSDVLFDGLKAKVMQHAGMRAWLLGRPDVELLAADEFWDVSSADFLDCDAGSEGAMRKGESPLGTALLRLKQQLAA